MYTQKELISSKTNWGKFLNRHNMIWDTLPESWLEGAFTGNGLLGTMIYCSESGRLGWDLGRSDVTDHRATQYRLPIGKIQLITSGKIISAVMRLELWDAVVTGEIKTDKGAIHFRTYTHAKEMVNVIEINTFSEEYCTFEFISEKSINPRKVVLGESETKLNPSPFLIKLEDIDVNVQPLLEGGEYATAWKEVESSDKKKTLFFSVGNSYPGNEARLEAIYNIQKVISNENDKLFKSHREWWHKYYQSSFLSIPDKRLEGFYWIQMYKLASATRQDRVAIDLLGPWYKTTRWPAIWWNLNIQLAYWPVYVSNHLELGKSLTKMLDKNIENLSKNTEEFSSDSASISVISGYECIGKTKDPSDLTWALHNYWLQYRYSMDKSILESLYKILRKSVNQYLHILYEDEDGMLHLPLLTSPEYPKMAVDTSYSLSLLQWGLQVLIDTCTELGLEDEKFPEWKDTLQRLSYYHIDETGLMIGKDVPYDIPHRHFSHLLMIYPLYTLNWDSVENRELILKSVERWQELDSQMCGYSYIVAASMYASFGMAEKALDKINQFMDDKISSMGAVLTKNTMYVETNVGGGNYSECNPTIETPLATARAIQDMLLQSWNNKIRIFPAVPDQWENVKFENLRAEGGFLVSAERKCGKIAWIRIESLADEPCCVKINQKQTFNIVSEKNVHCVFHDNLTFELDLQAGESVLLITQE